MSLIEQLSPLRAGNIVKLPEDIVSKILHNEVKRLSESGLIEGAPKAGRKLKDFKLSNLFGEERSPATVQLVSENKQIQELIEEGKLEGVHVTACKGCADQLGACPRMPFRSLRLPAQTLRNSQKIMLADKRTK